MIRNWKNTDKLPAGISAVRSIRDAKVKELGILLLYNLTAAFPTGVLSPRDWDHEKWDEPSSFLARYLNYDSTDSFLIDCGFSISEDLLDHEERESAHLPTVPFEVKAFNLRKYVRILWRKARQEFRKRPFLFPVVLAAVMLLLSGVLLGIFVILGRSLVGGAG